MNNQDNMLIAEFMGMENTLNGWKDVWGLLSEEDKTNYYNKLKFDTDPDWLIRLLKRIDDLDATSYRNVQGEEEEWEVPFRKLSSEEIEVLYNKCVHFTKWWDEVDLMEKLY